MLAHLLGDEARTTSHKAATAAGSTSINHKSLSTTHTDKNHEKNPYFSPNSPTIFVSARLTKLILYICILHPSCIHSESHGI